MKRLAIIAAVLLAGCSSFKLGGVCYLPHGMAGECRIVPAAPVAAPAASGVSA